MIRSKPSTPAYRENFGKNFKRQATGFVDRLKAACAHTRRVVSWKRGGLVTRCERCGKTL